MKFVLLSESIRHRAVAAVAEAPAGHAVVIKKPTRSLEQNAAQWPILDAFSRQLIWPVNGAMVKMTPDEWKDVLTGAFRQESMRMAQGLDGGVVVLGMRTSEMSKETFSTWLEFLHSVAADRGVIIERSNEQST